MGLTIHYRFQTECPPRKARQLVADLRQRALALPFQEVGDLVIRDGNGAADPGEAADLGCAALVDDGGARYRVAPARLFAFRTWPGEGCEVADFGLCAYPKTLSVPGRRSVATGLTGWSWRSFCKTQYASNPKFGGLPNFLRCHLLVVKMLEAAQELGILQEVHDEGEYWEKRDVQVLAREVGDWNEMIGAFAGKMKDLHGEALEAAIFDFPNFEHLEAKGRANHQKDDA